MTRLVIHTGTHATGWAATARQLISWRERLEEIGVHLHALDENESWLADGYALATGARPAAVVDAAERAVRDGASILLLSSERLEDSLRDAEHLANLTAFAEELTMPLTLLVVLRDQLGYLNHLYGERVGHLQMARDFSTFSAHPTPSERFDYGSAFQLPIAAADIDLVAVRYVEMEPRSEARSMLSAIGLAAEDLTGLPKGETAEGLPGPLLVAAKRLLFKRLWRLGLITKLPRPRLMQIARTLAAHAEERGWDAHSFWGWDSASREAAIGRFGPGNDLLAETLWGRPWGDDWETGVFDDVDLAERDPGQVVDVLGAVDAIVQELQAGKASVDSD